MAAAAPKPAFVPPFIYVNKEGWGPRTPTSSSQEWEPTNTPLDKYRDTPYQPFAKGDKLGKAADFTGTAYPGRGNRYHSQFGGGGDMYSYYHAEDESSFQLVDTRAQARPGYFKNHRWQNRTSRRDLHRARDDRRLAGLQTLTQGGKNRDRDRQRLERKWQKRFSGRKRWNDRQTPLKLRCASVDVKPTWEVKQEIEFSRLGKLNMEIAEPVELMRCGSLEYYDKSFDKISVKSERPLQSCDRTFHKVTTTDDPIIRSLAAQGNVFATDAVLSTLMCCSRSVYSWDIVVHRVGNKLFLDKRDDSTSTFDFVTVNETAFEPPQDDNGALNSDKELCLEATYINYNFSQQCLKRGVTHKFENPNPFAQDGEEQASVGYIYRKWDLGDGVNLVARCEFDGAIEDVKSKKPSFINIKTLNEWDFKGTGMDWRQKLDSQRGAVLATELKNNACKLAKWTCSSLLAGSSWLRLGYVSRVSPNDNRTHTILGTQSFKPADFATQMSLNMQNCWAILRAIIDICLKLPLPEGESTGKYVIMKDPTKQIMRIYSVPDDAFDGEEESSETEEEEDDEERIGIRLRDDDAFGNKMPAAGN